MERTTSQGVCFMRFAPLFALAAVVATPAAAQEVPSASSLAERLSDPRVQEGAAAALALVVGTVLDTRVGPLAQHFDPRVRAGDTLGDIARRDDPDLDRSIHDRARQMVRATGDAATVAAELGRTAHRLGVLAEAIASGPDRQLRED
jgi:hypothetical protein